MKFKGEAWCLYVNHGKDKNRTEAEEKKLVSFSNEKEEKDT